MNKYKAVKPTSGLGMYCRLLLKDGSGNTKGMIDIPNNLNNSTPPVTYSLDISGFNGYGYLVFEMQTYKDTGYDTSRIEAEIKSIWIE